MDRVSECKAIFEIGKTIDDATVTVARTSPLSVYLGYSARTISTRFRPDELLMSLDWFRSVICWEVY